MSTDKLVLACGAEDSNRCSFDTAGNVQVFFMELAKELKLRRNVQFSVFCLDYGQW